MRSNAWKRALAWIDKYLKAEESPEGAGRKLERHLPPGQFLAQARGDDFLVTRLEVDRVNGNFVEVAPLVWSLLDVDVGLTLGQRHLDNMA